MNIQKQIDTFIASLPDQKRHELVTMHQLTTSISPATKLWFHDGKNSENKTVANPTIGYGLQTLRYAGGETKEWFQLGISTNKTGFTIYALGIDDKSTLSKLFGDKIGKASVGTYSIKFKSLKDIDMNVLEALLQFALEKKRD